jgi:putative ABC transport system substrate-binding protein
MTCDRRARAAVKFCRARVAVAAFSLFAGIFGAFGDVRADEAVVLVRPAVVGSEAQLFEQVRQGIQTGLRSANKSMVEVVIAEHDKPPMFATRIQDLRPDTVIALGRRSLKGVRDSGFQGRIVAGAVDLRLNESLANTIAISLFPDPRPVFSKTKQVLPGARRIVVVSSPERLREIRDVTEKAAREERLTLVTHEADTVGELATTYLNIVRYGNPETDVLWIIDNGPTFSSDVLPRIVELAWSRQFPVISNFVDHVSKGSLLASYPDARELGVTLGRLGASLDRMSRVEPLRNLKFAANLRTARHLLPSVDIRQVESADLLLGQR